MKRISAAICLSFALFSAGAHAGINAKEGMYVGLDAVGGQFDSVPGAAVSSSLIPIGIFLRPYVGYRINDFFAVESSFNSIINDSHAGDLNPPPGYSKKGPDHYRLYTIDLAGKVIYSFANGFSVFGKAGLAYAHQDVYNEVYWPFNTPWIKADNKTNAILPLVGAGVSYNFTQQVAAQLTATHLNGNHGIGNINMLGFGVNYTF